MNDTMNASLVLNIEQSITIDATPEVTFRGLIARLTSLNVGANNELMPMCLEEQPGGRWFRDLGNDTGHLWGFVQSIKPPSLLEICGPMFMSHAVASNLIIRLKATDSGTEITLRHQVLGQIPEDFRSGLAQGWDEYLTDVKNDLQN